jgi:hypothetical protein
MWGVAKNPARPRSVPPAKPTKRPRGRPPRPGGRKPQTDVQRAYRARLVAAGKVVKLVEANATADLAMVADVRERLHHALLKLELRKQDVIRLTSRNAYLEHELKREERHHTNALKEIIVLKQQAASSARPRPLRNGRRAAVHTSHPAVPCQGQPVPQTGLPRQAVCRER